MKNAIGPNGNTCLNCANFAPTLTLSVMGGPATVASGQCRRRPPVAGKEGDEFPGTLADCWCGEWEAAMADQAAARLPQATAEDAPEVPASAVRLTVFGHDVPLVAE